MRVVLKLIGWYGGHVIKLADGLFETFITLESVGAWSAFITRLGE